MFPEQALQALHGDLFIIRGQVPALQHGVHALDGADADPRRGVEGVAGQALDDVLLGELEVVVGRGVLLELLEGLVAEVAAVHQEQDPPGAGELDQPVRKHDGEEGLAGAGGHLHQRAGPVLAQRLLDVGDGPALGGQSSSSSGGMCCMRARKVLPRSMYSGNASAACSKADSSHPARVSGRWKANTGRARGAGSSPLVKRVSMPVDW